jgi:hypothetical protein
MDLSFDIQLETHKNYTIESSSWKWLKSINDQVIYNFIKDKNIFYNFFLIFFVKVNFYSLLFVFIPGIFFNFLTIIIFLRPNFWKKKSTMGFYYSLSPFLGNLCILSFIIFNPIVLNYLSNFLSILKGGKRDHSIIIFEFSQVNCRIKWFIITTLLNGSGWFHVLMTYDRTINILHPRKFKFFHNYRNLFKLTILMYIIIIIPITSLHLYRNEKYLKIEQSTSSSKLNVSICQFKETIIILVIFLALPLRFLPLILIFIMNIIIIRRIIIKQKLIKKVEQKKKSSAATLSNNVSQNSENEVKSLNYTPSLSKRLMKKTNNHQHQLSLVNDYKLRDFYFVISVVLMNFLFIILTAPYFFLTLVHSIIVYGKINVSFNLFVIINFLTKITFFGNFYFESLPFFINFFSNRLFRREIRRIFKLKQKTNSNVNININN